MKKLFLAMGILAISFPASAQTANLKPLNVVQMEGTYAGTFLCSSGEMGMSLNLHDIGPTIKPDGKGVNTDKRLITGVLNFFPTVGNPSAPHGAFEVSGTADVYSQFSKIKLNPGKWLDKPDNFGASGLDGIVSKAGHFTGKPTVSGCHSLNMTKLRTH